MFCKALYSIGKVEFDAACSRRIAVYVVD